MIAGFLPQFHLNTTFAAYLDRFLFAPLGMDATGLSITAAQASGHMAVGHTREDVSAYRPLGTRRAMFPHLERDEGAVNWGAGGIIMSVRDAVSPPSRFPPQLSRAPALTFELLARASAGALAADAPGRRQASRDGRAGRSRGNPGDHHDRLLGRQDEGVRPTQRLGPFPGA